MKERFQVSLSWLSTSASGWLHIPVPSAVMEEVLGSDTVVMEYTGGFVAYYHVVDGELGTKTRIAKFVRNIRVKLMFSSRSFFQASH